MRERERQRARERKTEQERERERKTERESETRETERDRERKTEREKDRERERWRRERRALREGEGGRVGRMRDPDSRPDRRPHGSYCVAKRLTALRRKWVHTQDSAGRRGRKRELCLFVVAPGSTNLLCHASLMGLSCLQ